MLKREVRVEMGLIVIFGGVVIGGELLEYRKYGIVRVNVLFIKIYLKLMRIDLFLGLEIVFRFIKY